MHNAIGRALGAMTLVLGMATGAPAAEPKLMSAEWAKQACDAWNADPVLTNGLAESGWADNDGGQGFKALRLYRQDCKGSDPIELRISKRDGKAMCVYGGKFETTDLNLKKDYIMFAETGRWQEMGRGDYGPMRAMMFGRLKFQGPKMEAMGNMGPFSNFLRLTGAVQSDPTCPQ